ncbi:MAG: hypothetical protein ACSLFQ_07665 [Thermoanaerobaculia bacterium]
MNEASGVISGGWEYVTAAYALTALFLGTYVVSVLLRFSQETKAARRRASGSEVNS